MNNLNPSRSLAARPCSSRFAAMFLLPASDLARASIVFKSFSSCHVRKFFRQFVLSGLLALAGPVRAQVADVTVTVSAPSAVMHSTGLGVGSSVYDNYLVDTAVPGNLKAAGVGMVRYPGGSYADIFHWQTTSITTGQGGYIAANTGFVNWITKDVIAAGASAIITVNYGSNPAGTGGADPSEAAGWVNYANVTKGYGVKYWEIGNEVYGNGYYTGSGWECDLHYNSTSGREGQDALGPAAYGSNVNLFVSAMKAVDPTIKVGAVLTTYGYWPDASQGVSPDWNANVLQQCGTNIDFVILHYYPDGGSGGGTNIIAKTSEIPAIVSATRSLINTYCGSNAPNVEIAVTEANGDTFTNSYPAESLFTADLYCSWMENGAVTMDWQELHHSPPATFLVSASNGGPHRPWYGALMSSLLARSGDAFVSATSDNPQVRVHATLRQDGRVGLLLINESATSSQSVNVTVNGPALTSTATQYQFGAANFAGNNPLPSSGVNTNTVTGAGNSFTINVPSFTMIELLIPVAPPQLTIIPYGTDVILTWPTNYAGFTTGFNLEFATNLAPPAVWRTNSTAPVVSGGQNVVTNPITGSQMFFRLTQ